jgi:hypothetical protein
MSRLMSLNYRFIASLGGSTETMLKSSFALACGLDLTACVTMM